MESLIGPIPSWDAFPDIASTFFQTLRSPNGNKCFASLTIEYVIPIFLLYFLNFLPS